MAYSYLGEPEAARVGVRTLFRASPIAGVVALPGDICEMVARFVPEQRWAVVRREEKTGMTKLVTAPIGEESIDSPLASWDPWSTNDNLYMECRTLRRIRAEWSGPTYHHQAGSGVKPVTSRLVLEAVTPAGRRLVPPTYLGPTSRTAVPRGESGEYVATWASPGGYVYRTPRGAVIPLGDAGFGSFDFRCGLVSTITKKTGLCIYDTQSGELRAQNWESIAGGNLYLYISSFVVDPNVVLLYEGGIRKFATYDIREGKKSLCQATIYRAARRGDEIAFESDYLLLGSFVAMRYDMRANRPVDWWRTVVSTDSYDNIRTIWGRAYWG
jgi:hypothetical protein